MVLTISEDFVNHLKEVGMTILSEFSRAKNSYEWLEDWNFIDSIKWIDFAKNLPSWFEQMVTDGYVTVVEGAEHVQNLLVSIALNIKTYMTKQTMDWISLSTMLDGVNLRMKFDNLRMLCRSLFEYVNRFFQAQLSKDILKLS